VKSGISANQLWTQTPVAARLVEVNTKTGFSLTAGSYSVRASSTQQFYILCDSVASKTATASSVTTTRAIPLNNGDTSNATSFAEANCSLVLTDSTTLTVYKNTAGSTFGRVRAMLSEWF
tara:strand:- start:9 stop:368 length:360 start_codon:yes stop_codon:yes gene_type:complete